MDSAAPGTAARASCASARRWQTADAGYTAASARAREPNLAGSGSRPHSAGAGPNGAPSGRPRMPRKHRTKCCRWCGERQPIDQFAPSKFSPDGYGGRCLECIIPTPRRANQMHNTPARPWGASEHRHRGRPACGALARSTGLPCKRTVLGRGGRCSNHGGMSTGPRTAEGRQRCTEAARRRWAAWRAERSAE
jgi:hypothetical protein